MVKKLKNILKIENRSKFLKNPTKSTFLIVIKLQHMRKNSVNKAIF